MAERNLWADEPDARKAALIAELAQARTRLSRSFHQTQEELDGVRSVASRKALWLGTAAAGGWLVAKLTGRKSSRSKAGSSRGKAAHSSAPAQQAARSGWLLALLGVVGTMVRPAVTSYVTHWLNDYLSRAAGNGTQPRRPAQGLRR